MLVFGDHAVTRAMTIWMACAPTVGHDVVQAQVSVMGHVLVHDPVGARVWADVHDFCCYY